MLRSIIKAVIIWQLENSYHDFIEKKPFLKNELHYNIDKGEPVYTLFFLFPRGTG